MAASHLGATAGGATVMMNGLDGSDAVHTVLPWEDFGGHAPPGGSEMCLAPFGRERERRQVWQREKETTRLAERERERRRERRQGYEPFDRSKGS